MAQNRKRYNDEGNPLPCRVVIPERLAQILYRERILRGFKDETELVSQIVREWAEKLQLEPVKWAEVLDLLKRDEAGPV